MPKAGYLDFEALNHEDDKARKLCLSLELADEVHRKHPARRFTELLYNVPSTLSDPLSINRGLRERGGPQCEWGYAYVGLPSFKPDGYGNEFVPRNQVFVVYMNDDWNIFDWSWEPISPDDPEHPDRLKGGYFGEKLWSKSQKN
ncbi:MAG: hypothetical protein IH984_03345 [Planctomycetes bacterium]|nr:hypothetical protein [Planctomycetota bacterium]